MTENFPSRASGATCLLALITLSLCACATASRAAFDQRPAEAATLNSTSSPAPALAPTLSPTATSTPPALTRILFTGDINPGRCVARIAIEADDFTLPYQAVADELRSADIAVGSLDGSITDRATPLSCPQTMNLVGPARTAEGLQFAGFDVISVATNHIKNCGAVGCWNEALLDSMKNLKAAGIAAVGGGSTLEEARAPFVIEHNGIRFAFLAASSVGQEMWAGESEPGTAPLLIENIAADIKAARALADVVIVLPQWGGEYTDIPNWDQFKLAGAMMDAGATLVIGNQAHWVQAVETFPDGVVAYALGNFVFDQGWSEKTKQGVVFEAVFRGATLESWRLLPIYIHDNYQPRWAEPEKAKEILDSVEQANAGLLVERGAR
ncbi:MAG: CapA family protein [Chloroflexi bacterium]|nr:CapA family protein [Chloroflexota bacterium]